MNSSQRDQIESEVRDQLTRTIAMLRPYAQSQVRFNDIPDLQMAIKLAMQTLERAAAGAQRLGGSQP